MRDKLVFGVTSAVVSFALFKLLSAAYFRGWPVSGYHTGEFSIVLALMLTALGVGWRRKLAFIAATTGGILAIEWFARAAGIAALATSDPSSGTVAFNSNVWYFTFTPAFPIVMLALFVGRNPAVLWTRRGAPRGAPRGARRL